MFDNLDIIGTINAPNGLYFVFSHSIGYFIGHYDKYALIWHFVALDDISAIDYSIRLLQNGFY